MSSVAEALLDEMWPELATRLENTFKSLLLSGGGHKYPEWVSVEQASEITSYSKNSLYQMHLKGKVPGAKKVGGKLLFETKALQEWVKNGGRV